MYYNDFSFIKTSRVLLLTSLVMLFMCVLFASRLRDFWLIKGQKYVIASDSSSQRRLTVGNRSTTVRWLNYSTSCSIYYHTQAARLLSGLVNEHSMNKWRAVYSQWYGCETTVLATWPCTTVVSIMALQFAQCFHCSIIEAWMHIDADPNNVFTWKTI